LYDNGEMNEGRAYVYLGSATGLDALPAWTAEGDQTRAEFGNSVASAGGVNGDGYDDVVVGVPSYDNDLTDEGRAYLYLGSVAGLSRTAAWTAEGNQASGDFGSSVATPGDVNGDGYDVAVGARLYTHGQMWEGRAAVFFGSPRGLRPAPTLVAEGDQANAYFGGSVNTAGDLTAMATTTPS
jgi:hypothetical protein